MPVARMDDHEPASGDVPGFFAEHGYARLPSFADARDVAFIRGRLEAMWAARTGFDRGYQFDLTGEDDENNALAFPQIIHPSTFAPELLRTGFFLRAQALARELLGPQARFSSDHALLKKPMIGPGTPWHQDQGFRDPAFEYREISIWLALQPTDTENGCMRFVPGSHRSGVLPHRPLGGNEKVHAIECIGAFDPASAVECPLPAGGCTVHGGRTLHGAGPNLSVRPRAAWVLIFELPPVRLASAHRADGGVSRQTARARREKRWQRRGGAFVILWRHVARLDLRDPRAVSVLLQRVASKGAGAMRRWARWS